MIIGDCQNEIYIKMLRLRKKRRKRRFKVKDQLNDDGIKELEIGLDETKKQKTKNHTQSRGKEGVA